MTITIMVTIICEGCGARLDLGDCIWEDVREIAGQRHRWTKKLDETRCKYRDYCPNCTKAAEGEHESR